MKGGVMAAKQQPDLREQIRGNATHLAQINRAIAEATVQPEEAVRSRDLDLVRRANKRIEDLHADVHALEEIRDELAAARIKADNGAAEAARAEAVDKVLVPHADIIIAKAERLESAVGELATAYGELEAAVARMYGDWPASVPKVPFYEFRLTDVKQRLAGAMGYASAGGEFGRLLVWANSFNERTTTLSESVRRAVTNYLRDVRAVPLPAAKKELTENVG